MKKLNKVIEGMFDVDDNLEKIGKQLSDEWYQKFVKEHEKEFIKKKYSKSDYRWVRGGFDFTECRVDWSKIIEWWKEGIEIPIARVGYLGTAFLYSVDKIPKNIEDIKYLCDVIWKKTKIDFIGVDRRLNVTDLEKVFIYHPKLQTIGLTEYDTIPMVLPDLDYKNVNASNLKISGYDSTGKIGTGPTPKFDYKKISGMKNLKKITVDFKCSLLDLSDWIMGRSRSCNVSDEQKEAIDYLFSRNPKLKSIVVDGMHAYNGNERRCKGKPYYIRIEKSGSEITTKFF